MKGDTLDGLIVRTAGRGSADIVSTNLGSHSHSFTKKKVRSVDVSVVSNSLHCRGKTAPGLVVPTLDVIT